MSEKLGDAPIEPQYKSKMEAVARAIDELFNGVNCKPKDRQTGFILLTFPFGEGEGRCNYISNGANRDDVVTMFKEQIKRFEGQPEVTGNA